MAATAPSPELDADVAEHKDVVFEPRLAGVIAEFDRPEILLSAAASVRDAGFTRWDTHTPFPLHGIEKAMSIKPTILPWIVLCGALTGTTIAVLMQYWLNASFLAEKVIGWPFSGYPYPISGKPYWSLPANVPIIFELTVLLAAFSAFFGQIGLNRLYRFYNPMFKLERFRRVTTDRFFIAIDANDPKFDVARITAKMRELGAVAVDECWDDESRKLPAGFATAGLVLFALALVPPALVMRHRSVSFDVPEYHPIQDMDFQEKFKPQQRNVFFADQRADRPQVPGTIARGQLQGGDDYYLGIRSGQALASLQDQPASGGNAANGNAASGGQNTGGNSNNQGGNNAGGQGGNAGGQGGDAGGGQGGNNAPAAPAAGMNENQNWADEIPKEIEVNERFMLRGQERFQVYCAPCHGMAGYGDGLVNRRALALKAPTWVPVPSLHAPQTRNRADGYIFRAITEGVRKMPAYGSQILPEDRWAIVLYVRALQRSQGAAPK